MLELIVLLVVCALIGLAGLGAIGWTLLSGEELGVESIFLALVGLLLAGLFFGLSAWIARRSPLGELWRAKAAAGAVPAETPPPQKSEEVPEKAPKSAS